MIMISLRLKVFVCAFALLLTATAEAQRARRVSLQVAEPAAYVPVVVPDNANVWDCWYGGNGILCRLSRKFDPGAEGAVALANQKIDPRLPELVGTIRNYPELLVGEIVAIPTYGVPFDMAFAAELAQSVMCGGRLYCGVVFAR